MAAVYSPLEPAEHSEGILIPLSRLAPDVTVDARKDLWSTQCERGRILLESLPDFRHERPLHIARGETLELPGRHYVAQIVAPDEKAGGMPDGAYALALAPGEYHAECGRALRLSKKDDPTSTLAWRFTPCNFNFAVRNDRAQAPRLKREKETGEESISWGETLDGLQGGLQRMTEKEFAAMPADQRKEVAADEILMRLYIRNTTDKPIRISYDTLKADEAAYWITDAKGGDHSVEESEIHTVANTLPVKTLLPGEKIPAGWGRLQLTGQSMENSFKMQIKAKPGQYTLRSIAFVQIEGIPGVVELATGPLPFTISAP